MAFGLYLSHWTTIDPLIFQPSSGGIDLDFVIIRARGGGRDDSKFTQHRKWAETQKVKAGAMIWGPDMYLGYAPGTDSGKKQAEDFWSLINAGGRTWEILPEVDIEYQPKEFDEQGRVKTYWPIPPNFLSTWVEPVIKTLQDKLGMSPMLYTSPSIIRDVLARSGGLPSWLASCPLHIAHYNVGSPSTPLFPGWVFWQYTNTTNWVPGVTAICMERFQGTRQELKAWCKNPTQTVTPVPVPSPGAEIPSTIEEQVETILERVNDIQRRLSTIEGWLRGYPPS